MRYAVLRQSKGIHHVIVHTVTIGETPSFDILETFSTGTCGSWFRAEIAARNMAQFMNQGMGRGEAYSKAMAGES